MKRIFIAGALLSLFSLTVSSGWAAHQGFDQATFGMASSAKGKALELEQQAEEKPPILSGKVVQTMDSGGYTYLLLESKGERGWAAIEATPVQIGDRISLKPGVVMANFSSKGLNRTFDRIVFSEGIVLKEGTKKGDASKKSAGSAGAVVPFSKISVEKATGANAFRIADLYANQKLNGKKVVVRGKVVKVSTGIMERNWIHLQDGSGSPSKKNHNLVVTSQAVPDVGDIVTVSGTLVRNKDFGSGYRYDVIVEKATVVRDEAEKKAPPAQ